MSDEIEAAVAPVVFSVFVNEFYSFYPDEEGLVPDLEVEGRGFYLKGRLSFVPNRDESMGAVLGHFESSHPAELEPPRMRFLPEGAPPFKLSAPDVILLESQGRLDSVGIRRLISPEGNSGELTPEPKA